VKRRRQYSGHVAVHDRVSTCGPRETVRRDDAMRVFRSVRVGDDNVLGKMGRIPRLLWASTVNAVDSNRRLTVPALDVAAHVKARVMLSFP